MKARHALFLRAFAAWTLFVWLFFVRNLFDSDRSAAFIAIHLALALVSAAFAVGTFAVVRRERGGEH